MVSSSVSVGFCLPQMDWILKDFWLRKEIGWRFGRELWIAVSEQGLVGSEWLGCKLGSVWIYKKHGRVSILGA